MLPTIYWTRPALEGSWTLPQKYNKNQNFIELFFKDIKHFDAQNPVFGSLIKEVDVGKKRISVDF